MIMRLGRQNMKSKKNGLAEILTGGIVFLTAVFFVGYSIKATNFSTGTKSDNFILYANFQSLQGIRLGSDILLAGVKVGTVSSIKLDKDSFQAQATFSLFDDYKLPEDTEAVIDSDGLLGGKYISLNVGGSDITLNTGDELLYTQSSMNLFNLLNKFTNQ